MSVIFEWDDKKAAKNIQNHKVTFEEASTVFGDPFSIPIYDPLYSKKEDRFVTIDNSYLQNILIVIHCDRGDNIRIISARKANIYERKQYEEKR